MTVEYQCIRCNKFLTKRNKSKEHIVPRAIGGKKTVHGILCKKCNEIKGTEWDIPLVEQTRFLFTYFKGTRQGKPSPGIIGESVDGKKVRLLDSGKMLITDTQYELIDVNGKKYINLEAPDEHNARKALKKLQDEHPEYNIVIEAALKKAVHTSTPFVGVFKELLTIGGSYAGKSIVCSCLSLATLKKINPHDCHNAIDYLFKDGEACLGYYYADADPIINRPEKATVHCVSIIGTQANKTLVGYIEYFSVFRILVLLDDNYRGPDIEENYCININTGLEVKIKTYFPTDLKTIRKAFDYVFYNTSIIKNLLEKSIDNPETVYLFRGFTFKIHEIRRQYTPFPR